MYTINALTEISQQQLEGFTSTAWISELIWKQGGEPRMPDSQVCCVGNVICSADEDVLSVV